MGQIDGSPGSCLGLTSPAVRGNRKSDTVSGRNHQFTEQLVSALSGRFNLDTCVFFQSRIERRCALYRVLPAALPHCSAPIFFFYLLHH